MHLDKHSTNGDIVQAFFVFCLLKRPTHAGAPGQPGKKEITFQILGIKTQPFEREAVRSASAGRPQHPHRSQETPWHVAPWQTSQSGG